METVLHYTLLRSNIQLSLNKELMNLSMLIRGSHDVFHCLDYCMIDQLYILFTVYLDLNPCVH